MLFEKFINRGLCGPWNDAFRSCAELIELGTAICYFVIFFILMTGVSKSLNLHTCYRRLTDNELKATFAIWGSFVFMCGTAHLCDWFAFVSHPYYHLFTIISGINLLVSAAGAAWTFYLRLYLFIPDNEHLSAIK